MELFLIAYGGRIIHFRNLPRTPPFSEGVRILKYKYRNVNKLKTKLVCSASVEKQDVFSVEDSHAGKVPNKDKAKVSKTEAAR